MIKDSSYSLGKKIMELSIFSAELRSGEKLPETPSELNEYANQIFFSDKKEAIKISISRIVCGFYTLNIKVSMK